MGFKVKICVANALQGSRIQEGDPPITVSEFSRLVITAEWTQPGHSTGFTFQRTGHQMEGPTYMRRGQNLYWRHNLNTACNNHIRGTKINVNTLLPRKTFWNQPLHPQPQYIINDIEVCTV